MQRAVDALDGFTLRVLEALTLAAADDDRVRAQDVRAMLGAVPDEDVEAALAELRELVLVWGDPVLHLVAGVREVIGPYPAGLGRPAAALLGRVPDALADPDAIRAVVAECDDEERDVLERLAQGPPVGTVRRLRPGDRPPASHRLVQRGLLIALDEQRVELPREVAAVLRPGLLGPIRGTPPDIAIRQRTPAELDRAGATSVLEALRLVAALADSWTAQPPAQLRAGGVSVRDLRRTAKDLGVEQAAVAVLVETAAAAGLVNSTHELESVYLPTPEYDQWLHRAPAARWGELATAWLAMTRQPSMAGKRGERDRIISPLSPDAERGAMPGLRAQVLGVLASLPPGAGPLEREQVLDVLVWHAPRRAAVQRPVAAAILAEADLLGITAAGGLTGYSRTLLDGSRAVAEQVLTGALPEPVDHFLLQPDLTVVVPGPPEAGLARDLALVADLESSGGASVYRISEQSVRRALDSGRSAGELQRFVQGTSRTPVPQALEYLIGDVARRHGALRSGVAAAYLRSDDEVLLSRVLADRRAAPLAMRRIAPTVAICAAPVTRVLAVLREAGYAPAAEAPDGEVVALGAEAARAPSRPAVRAARTRTAVEGPQLAELVRRIRAGDELTTLSRRVQPITQQVPGVTSAATMGTLRDAIRGGRQVLINCAEADGTATRHTIVPISMAGGYVRGHEPSSTKLQSFPLHRLIAVRVLDEELFE